MWSVPTESPTVHRGSSSSAQRRLGDASRPPAAAAPACLPSAGRHGRHLPARGSDRRGRDGCGLSRSGHQARPPGRAQALAPDQASDAEIVPRFYQEGRSAARLDHENIARVYSIGQDGPFHYIAFEYIEGVTVRQRVETVGRAAGRRGGQHRASDRAGAGACVDARGRPPRHQALEHHHHAGWAGQAGRHGAGAPIRARRRPRADPERHDAGHVSTTSVPSRRATRATSTCAATCIRSAARFFTCSPGARRFPGGTVLQKLIQHQEEAPADVRTLNPAVPVELAGIIAKLMAKDRDRRYQTPEHLVRDLLGVAGSIGLATASSAFPARWHDEGHRPAWERHLVWLVPGRGTRARGARPCLVGTRASPDRRRPRRASEPQSRRLALRSSDVAAASGSDGGSPPAVRRRRAPSRPNRLPAYLRNIPVSSNEDLLEILATAPRRSVIVLSDDGPYRLGGRTWSSRAPAPLANPDLTIKAEPGVRPLLKFATDARSADHPPT